MPRKLLSGADLNGQRAINAGDPNVATDLATKNYVDNSIRGIDWKESVRVATTGPITLSGTQTIDTIAVVAGNRVLVKDQADQTTNGIYVVAAGAWTRAVDADSSTEVTSGMAVTVEEGSTNGDKMWQLTTNGPITLGTTALVFSPLGGGATYTAGNGLTLSGTDFAVGAGTGITVQADTISVDTSVVARKASADVGNGAATVIAVAHNLGTKDITWSLRQKSNDEFVDVDGVATDANTLTLTFATAPSSAQYRVTVHG